MERLHALIKRLTEQYEADAGNKSLLATATMIVAELQQQAAEEKHHSVSVVLPHFSNGNIGDDIAADKGDTGEGADRVDRVDKGDKAAEDNVLAEKKEATPAANFFDPLKEFPTLALKQREMKELNLAFEDNEASLNDKLKTDQKEIASKLVDTPVKDLRKAIGINDRYHFISELFRGDEDMYGRSIKTINGFNVYGEAALWISRELKTKLGWNEESGTVHLFDQLVRRRFA